MIAAGIENLWSIGKEIYHSSAFAWASSPLKPFDPVSMITQGYRDMVERSLLVFALQKTTSGFKGGDNITTRTPLFTLDELRERFAIAYNRDAETYLPPDDLEYVITGFLAEHQLAQAFSDIFCTSYTNYGILLSVQQIKSSIPSIGLDQEIRTDYAFLSLFNSHLQHLETLEMPMAKPVSIPGQEYDFSIQEITAMIFEDNSGTERALISTIEEVSRVGETMGKYLNMYVSSRMGELDFGIQRITSSETQADILSCSGHRNRMTIAAYANTTGELKYYFIPNLDEILSLEPGEPRTIDDIPGVLNRSILLESESCQCLAIQTASLADQTLLLILESYQIEETLEMFRLRSYFVGADGELLRNDEGKLLGSSLNLSMDPSEAHKMKLSLITNGDRYIASLNKHGDAMGPGDVDPIRIYTITSKDGISLLNQYQPDVFYGPAGTELIGWRVGSNIYLDTVVADLRCNNPTLLSAIIAEGQFMESTSPFLGFPQNYVCIPPNSQIASYSFPNGYAMSFLRSEPSVEQSSSILWYARRLEPYVYRLPFVRALFHPSKQGTRRSFLQVDGVKKIVGRLRV